MRRLLTSAAFVALAFSLASGCGGQSFEREGSADDGESGEGGISGTGSGGGANGGSGAVSSGGVPTTGGAAPLGGAAPMGGAMPAGGVGMSGTAGAGGEPSTCLLPPETGPCLAAFTRFAFDAETGLCLPFMYGGCDGNANNFQTIESCYAACSAFGPMLPASCSVPSDCTLVPATCCGCSEPSLANRVAVRRGQEATVQAAKGCHLVDCEACGPIAPNRWIGATCKADRCVAFDARQSELTACATTEDCALRQGLECCEGCSSSRLTVVALNKAIDPRPLLCGNAAAACDACEPSHVGVSPACVKGRCDVLIDPI